MKILLATDGSDTARLASDFLIGFPLPAGSQITLTTVIKAVLSVDKVERLSADRRLKFDSMQKTAEDDARILLENEAVRLAEAGFATDIKVLVGHTAEQLVRLATELKSDIIALGSHGKSDPRRYLLGSVSDHVFKHSPCSILIIKVGSMREGGAPRFPRARDHWRLLLSFDDSPPARNAVELCAALPLKGRTMVKAVTFMPMIHMYRQDILQQISQGWQQKKKAARLALDQVATAFNGKDTDVSTVLREVPNVSKSVLREADVMGSDLIVIGNKRKTKFERILLGSVTPHVAHHANCSVLSVR